MSELKQPPRHSHHGHRNRLKEEALSNDLEGMSSYQVLELLLFYVLPQKDTNELAHALIDKFGSLSAVFNADYNSLLEVKGIGAHTASLLALMPGFFRRYMQDFTGEKRTLLDLPQTVAYVKSIFIGKNYEEFYMICLSSQWRIIKAVLLNKGSISEVLIYPRIAVETALLHKARYVVLAHNHPGGRLQPSGDDLKLTQKIKALLAEMSIDVVDHIIVSGDEYYSFAEKGLLAAK